MTVLCVSASRSTSWLIVAGSGVSSLALIISKSRYWRGVSPCRREISSLLRRKRLSDARNSAASA